MEIKTYGQTAAPVPYIAPVLPKPPPSNPPPSKGVNAVNLSTLTPTRVLSNMTLGLGSVVQNIAYDPAHKQYYVTQRMAGTSGASTPYETTCISRVASNGALLDYMILQDAGHGYGLAIENLGSQVYIWITYNRPVYDTSPLYDLVRFPYSKGTFSRGKVPGLVTLQRMDSHYSTFDFDWINDWVMERYMNGNTMVCLRRKISDLNNGINTVYNTVNINLTGQTVQGNATVNDSIYVLVGASNGETLTPAQPTEIWRYNWLTGAKVDTADLATLGQLPDGTWLGGQHEPEGLTSYREATGKASLVFSLSLAPPNTKHTYYVYAYKNMGDAPS